LIVCLTARNLKFLKSLHELPPRRNHTVSITKGKKVKVVKGIVHYNKSVIHGTQLHSVAICALFRLVRRIAKSGR